jgi:hypothetical protein
MKWLKPKGTTPETPKGERPLWFTRSLLTSALRAGGCVVCAALAVSERRFLHSFLYEGMMSAMVRQKFLDGGGFCLRHFWMAKEIEDECWPTGGIGMAILCEDLVRQVQVQMSQREASDSRKRSREPRSPRLGRDCMFCVDLRQKEESLIEALEEISEEPSFARRFTADRFCARHGELAGERWHRVTRRNWASELVQCHLAELAGDLREFIRKHDYQHRHEQPGREHDVVLRAIAFLIGPKPTIQREKS